MISSHDLSHTRAFPEPDFRLVFTRSLAQSYGGILWISYIKAKHHIIDLDIVLPLDFERFARTWDGLGGRVGKRRGDDQF